MPRTIFVNLPVRDTEASAAFYAAIGFERDARFSQPGRAAAMTWSDTITFMLLAHDFFKGFLPHKDIADAGAVAQVLLALALDDRAAVDRMTDAAATAGGRADPRPPQDLPFMYGRSFEDPDGHIFEPYVMDMDAAAAAAGDGA